MPRPRPRLPPVTSTLCMTTSELPRGRQVQRGHETDRRGDLVCRESLTTHLQDFPFEVGSLPAAGGWISVVFQDYVSRDQRTGKRASAGPHDAQADGPVVVD